MTPFARNLLIGAAALSCVGVVMVVRELQRVPTFPPAAASQGPLTDIAGKPPVLANPPVAPLAPIASNQPAVAPKVTPSEMPEPQNPPHGTPPLALPGTPSPPDPFVAPAISQDPNRGRELL